MVLIFRRCGPNEQSEKPSHAASNLPRRTHLRHTADMSQKRSILVQIFFALLLAFAQQQAIWHELSHDFERIHASQKEGTGHSDAFCAKCLGLGHLGHANNGTLAELAQASYAPPLVGRTIRQPPQLTFVSVYLSRAPPFSS